MKKARLGSWRSILSCVHTKVTLGTIDKIDWGIEMIVWQRVYQLVGSAQKLRSPRAMSRVTGGGLYFTL